MELKFVKTLGVVVGTELSVNTEDLNVDEFHVGEVYNEAITPCGLGFSISSAEFVFVEECDKEEAEYMYIKSEEELDESDLEKFFNIKYRRDYISVGIEDIGGIDFYYQYYIPVGE